MPDLKIDAVLLDHQLRERIDLIAAARSLAPDAILHEALIQYLDREENASTKKYPQRTPVGGIITPM